MCPLPPLPLEPLKATPPEPQLSRRALLGGLFASSLGLADLGEAAAPLPGVDNSFWERPRELWLLRVKTGEELRAVYWRNGALAEGYDPICRLLRDVERNVAVQMDPTLLDVLAGVQGYYRASGYWSAVHVTSGFRTAATNRALRKEGAALNSMHLYGKAVDGYVPGIPVDHVAKVKQYLHRGGVGFYPKRGFVHLDTGSLRSWRG